MNIVVMINVEIQRSDRTSTDITERHVTYAVDDPHTEGAQVANAIAAAAALISRRLKTEQP